jgi:hypothetical protein
MQPICKMQVAPRSVVIVAGESADEEVVGACQWSENLEKSSFYNALLVLSELATTPLSRPQLTAHSLPAVPCCVGKSVLAAANPRTGRAAMGTIIIVRLVEVVHRIIAHGGRARRGQWVAHARGTRTAGIIGKGIAAASIASGSA